MLIVRTCSALGKARRGVLVVLGWGVQTLSGMQACKRALEGLMDVLEQLQLTLNGWRALLGIET